MKMFSSRAMTALAVAGGVLTGAGAHADVTFSGSSSNLAATVTFGVANGGNDLVVTLDNTSLFDVMTKEELLTGLFFNINGNPTLTPVSAFLGSGATVLYPTVNGATAPTAGNVGGEFAYLGGGTNLAYDASQGISSSGLGIFAKGNFGGPDLSAPEAVNGYDYALTSAGDNPSTGNSTIMGDGGGIRPIVQHAVVFTFSGFNGFSLSDISNVTFQYGPALTNGHLAGHLAGQVGGNVEVAPGYFDSIERLDNGSVRLIMHGTPNVNYVLEWRADGATWSDLCNLQSSNGAFEWVDTPPADQPQRFYRLKVGFADLPQ